MVDAKEIAASQTLRATRHLFHRHAANRRSGDERADTRAGVNRRPDLSLLERAEHTDVRKALHSAAAEHERYALTATAAGLLYHRRVSISIYSSGSGSLQVLIQTVEPNDRTADHEDVSRVAADDR